MEKLIILALCTILNRYTGTGY